MNNQAALLVTVAVCTRDRPGELEKLLDSATRLETRQGMSWELLVVDNGSRVPVEPMASR